MSKMDGLRAMREARYAEATARAAKPSTQPKAKPKLEKAEPAAEPATRPTAEQDDGLCGHRSMNGRTCTREAGHAAKSHRYS